MYYSNRLKCDRGTASSIVYADMAFKMLNAACFPSLYYEIHTTEMRREEEAFLALGWLLSNGGRGRRARETTLEEHIKRGPNSKHTSMKGEGHRGRVCWVSLVRRVYISASLLPRVCALFT